MALLVQALSAQPAFATAGELDPAFDVDGRVTTAFADPSSANAVAIQPDRKILVVGVTGGRFALARYATDGSLDTSFDGDGKTRTHFRGGGTARAVAIEADGDIVVVGDAGDFRRVAIARYQTDGSLDPTFSEDGKLTLRIRSGGNGARAVAVPPDGRIVVAGSTSSHDGSAAALVRLKPNGDLDASFGRRGIVTTQFDEGVGDAYGVAIQPDGGIVAVGEGIGAGGFRLARYRTDGRLDRRFGRRGIVASRFPGGARAVALQDNGRIVVAGIGGDIFGPFALARYLRTGKPDDTFSNDGHVRVQVGSGEESGESLVIQPDGKIVEVGYTDVPHEFGDTGNGAFALLRFRPRGRLDRSFGDRGTVLTEFDEGLALGQGVALQRNGRIVAAGWAGDRFGLARYLGA